MEFLKKVEIEKDGKKASVKFYQEDQEEVAVYVDGYQEGKLTLEKDIDDPERYAGWVLYLPEFLEKKCADGTVYDDDLQEAIAEVVDDMETL